MPAMDQPGVAKGVAASSRCMEKASLQEQPEVLLVSDNACSLIQISPACGTDVPLREIGFEHAAWGSHLRQG